MKILNARCSKWFKIVNLSALWFALLLGVNCAVLADVDGLSTNVLVQIQALQQEKASFTPAEQKMDSQLVFAFKQSQNLPIANGAVPQLVIAAQATNGMMLVDITGNVTPELLAQIVQFGGSIKNSFVQFHAIRASIPLSQLEAVAALSDLKFIRAALPPMNKSDPEGVVVHRADTARSTFRVNGSNVKVGVLSDSVDFLAPAQATGDLGPVTVLPGQSGVPGSGEGTAMLEIVYSLAPGAQLYFATGGNGEASFAQNILDLRAAGCDIIVDDIGYFDESPFQDGIIAQAVNTVTASGALYFSAAGNEGNLDSGTSGTWQGDFVNGGAVGAPANGKGGNIHSFGAANYDTITQGGRATFLFWADPAGASTNDYDLYVLDAAGTTIVASSINVQNGSQDPFETVGSTSAGQRVVIVQASGAPRFLYTSTYRGQFSIGTSGNITGHPTATNAFATGAVDVHTAYPNPFGGGTANPVENFSSDGPRRVFYNADGTPITPGDFSSTGGFVRLKPDIAAADGVTTTLPANSGLNPFFGTSAAAPHAAAIAALLKSYNPSLTPQQFRFVLTNTALDIMGPGFDQDSGAGIVMALQALQAAPLPLPTPNFQIITNFITGGNGNGIIDFNECNSMFISLTNNGTTNATTVQATLSTTTPGVTVSQATAVYPNIPQGGAATNVNPFQISTTPTFVCGTSIHFTLVIKCDQITLTSIFTVQTGVPGAPIRFDNASPVGIAPGPAGVSSTVNVTNIGSALTHVAVSADVFESFDFNLTLQLIGPDGTTVLLSQNNGGSGQSYGVDCTDQGRTTFDDNAFTSINTGIAPFVGTFLPANQLSAFIGKSGAAINGVWQLHAMDSFSRDSGAIECWSLFLTPAQCVDGGGQCPGIDLVLGMTGLPNPVLVQSNLTYTMTITNNGPDTATGVALSQTLPAGVTFVSVTSSQGAGSQSSNIVNCNLGTLLVGGTATVTVVVIPNTPGTIFSTATVGALEPDVNQANNTATTATLVSSPSADLAITLSANPNPVLLNGILTYTASVVNHGPSIAPNVVVTNTLPQNAIITGTSASQGASTILANVVITSLGTLPVGSNAIVTIQVIPYVPGGISATAHVSSDVGDPILPNNTATVNTTVTTAADLALSLTGPASTIVGSNLTYQVTVQNLGPSAATGLNIKDTLPPGVAYVLATSPQGICSTNGNVVNCLVSNLAVGASATVTITVGTSNLFGSVPVTIVDAASVTANQADPNTTNNSANLSTLVTFPMVNVVAAGAVLQSESFFPPDGMIEPGEKVTVLLRLQNLGNIDTTSNLTATLLNTGGVIPSGTQVQNYGTLTAGGAAFALPFTFVSGGTNGGTITASLQLQNGGTNLPIVPFIFKLPATNSFANTNNIVIPDHGQGTPYPASNLISGVTGLVGKVTVTLTNVNHTFPDDIDMLLVGPGGQSVLLMSHAGNNGVLTNTSLTFDDSVTNANGTRKYLPASSQILSGSYVPSQYGTVSFPTNTPPSPYGTNLAVFNGINPNGAWRLFVFDSMTGDAGIIVGGWSLGITAGSEVNPVVDLAVTGNAKPNPVLNGANLTYTFTITNNGPNPASLVQFTNVLAANVSFVSATNSAHTVCALDGNGAVYCSLTNLNTGSNVTVTIIVAPTSPGTITSVATVSGSDSDPNQSNNSATVVTTATVPIADVSVTLSGAASAVISNNVLYTITVTNNGPGAALGVVVKDPLPGALSFMGGQSSPPLGTPIFTNGAVLCNLGNLANGASVTVTLLLSSSQAITFTNTVSATTTSSDTNLVNNTNTVVTVFNNPAPNVVAAGAQLISSLPNGTLATGLAATISFQLANIGTADTTNLTATLLAANGVVAPSAAKNYGALLHGGPAIANTFSFTAGAVANGTIVATLQLTDGPNNLGTVNFSFNLAATNGFANANGIIIPDYGPASPYPSTLIISNVTGLISKATVTLNQLSHQFPNDVEILLASPSGRNVVLMSGVGGGNVITNVVLTFDDAASASLPASGQFGVAATPIVSGRYLPTDDGVSLAFPSPAPAGPYGLSLGRLNGTSANGTWTLYVLDNSPGDSGSITQGWSLALTTVSPVNSVADLGVSLSQPAGSVYAGNAFTYTVIVTNQGPINAANVVLTNTLPAGVSVVGTSLNYTTGANGTLVFNLGTLNVGSSATFTVTLKAAASGTYQNTINVSSDQADLNPQDNTAQSLFAVIGGPRLTATSGTANNTFALNLALTGQLGIYNILAATNINLSLSNWIVLKTVTNSLGIIHFTDTNAAGFPYRYYRAVLVP